MKMKYININGRGALVDESAEIKKGEYYAASDGWYVEKAIIEDLEICNDKRNGYSKIIFAEKELNLKGVPILPNWREWEVEQLASKSWNSEHPDYRDISEYSDYSYGFNRGYNKAKYTEEDLRKAIIQFATDCDDNEGLIYYDGYNEDDIKQYNNSHKWIDRYTQSLQKIPKYIVMESESVEIPNFRTMKHDIIIKPKLITIPEGITGIIKKIEYD